MGRWSGFWFRGEVAVEELGVERREVEALGRLVHELEAVGLGAIEELIVDPLDRLPDRSLARHGFALLARAECAGPLYGAAEWSAD